MWNALVAFSDQTAAVSKGPEHNFGLNMPVPGVGFQWQRNRSIEEKHIVNNPVFAQLEKYDKYLSK